MRAAMYWGVEDYMLYIEKTDTSQDIIQVRSDVGDGPVIAAVRTIGLYDWINEDVHIRGVVLHEDDGDAILIFDETGQVASYYLNLYQPERSHWRYVPIDDVE